MKKIIIIIIIIAIIGVVWWLSTRQESPQEEEGEEDVIVSLLENLEQVTGINFSEIQDVEFRWFFERNKQIEELMAAGKGFEVERISDEQYRSIESFFKDNGFEVDMYNVASGTVAGAVGYKKGEIICSIAAGVTGYKEATGQWIPEEWDTNDAEVKCGKASNLIETKNDENFSIVLEANPTTGYEWQVDFDSIYLELVDSKYVPDSSELVGSGGKETFEFLAKKSGITKIVFIYSRLWESVQPLEKKIYEIIIK